MRIIKLKEQLKNSGIPFPGSDAKAPGSGEEPIEEVKAPVIVQAP